MGARHAPAAPVAARRFRKAASAVVLVMVSVALALAASGSGHAEGGLAGGPLVKKLWASICADGDMDDVLREEGIVKLTRENTPRWLEEELLGLHEMDQAIANEPFELLWFCRKGDAAAVAASIADSLSSKGWLQKGAESDGAQTFVKKEGVCTWVMVECAQAGEDVVVVLRTRHT